MPDDDFAESQLVQSRLDDDFTQTAIAEELGLGSAGALQKRMNRRGLEFRTVLWDIRTGRLFREMVESGDLVPASALRDEHTVTERVPVAA